MPVSPDSRFASLPLLQVVAPDGGTRNVVALRLQRPLLESPNRHRVVQGEGLDLIALRLLGGEGLWWRILDANALVYPLDIQPGAVLAIPQPGPATQITRARSF
jgi:nucleoid-associated protein YgaU